VEGDMATNLAINDELLNYALKIGGFRSKKDTVNAALEEFIQKRKAEELIGLFGQIEYDTGYDYKTMRNRK
jgi:Arc/MetJ family transcription regulator